MDRKNDISFYKGHIKDFQKTPQLKRYLEDNSQLLLAYKKTERLTVAVYMITDLFDVREPLRWELRAKAVALLSFMSSLSTCPILTPEGDTFVGATEALSEILFPLELAMRMRLVSAMNFSLLKEEYLSLGLVLESCAQGGNVPQDVTFPENFFAYDDSTVSGQETQSNKGQSAIKDNKIKNIPDREKEPHVLKRQRKIIDKNFSKQPTSRPFQEAKESRRTVIIRLLRAKGELMIKDISSIITDCSEKTIQRELLSLIEDGVVQKRGERRWSTYSLVRNESRRI